MYESLQVKQHGAASLPVKFKLLNTQNKCVFPKASLMHILTTLLLRHVDPNVRVAPSNAAWTTSLPVKQREATPLPAKFKLLSTQQIKVSCPKSV
ncbi:hypothetical protein GJ496_011649 [Pomphorhynchus laevis]|nr:hypothetical protein GJ496_011649 [Pomphorhynchus laevis]